MEAGHIERLFAEAQQEAPRETRARAMARPPTGHPSGRAYPPGNEAQLQAAWDAPEHKGGAWRSPRAFLKAVSRSIGGDSSAHEEQARHFFVNKCRGFLLRPDDGAEEHALRQARRKSFCRELLVEALWADPSVISGHEETLRRRGMPAALDTLLREVGSREHLGEEESRKHEREALRHLARLCASGQARAETWRPALCDAVSARTRPAEAHEAPEHAEEPEPSLGPEDREPPAPEYGDALGGEEADEEPGEDAPADEYHEYRPAPALVIRPRKPRTKGKKRDPKW